MTGLVKTWIAVPPASDPRGGVYDVKSGAKGQARDGTVFGGW